MSFDPLIILIAEKIHQIQQCWELREGAEKVKSWLAIRQDAGWVGNKDDRRERCKLERNGALREAVKKMCFRALCGRSGGLCRMTGFCQGSDGLSASPLQSAPQSVPLRPGLAEKVSIPQTTHIKWRELWAELPSAAQGFWTGPSLAPAN